MRRRSAASSTVRSFPPKTGQRATTAVSTPSGAPPEPFVLDGEDWFTVEDGKTLSWAQVRATLDAEQARLADLASAIAKGTVKSPVPEPERFTLVLGITCHAVYHAGQVQLVKRLLGS